MSYREYEERYGARYDPTNMMWWTPYALLLPGRIIVDSISARGVLSGANDARGTTGRINNMYPGGNHGKYKKTQQPCFANCNIYDGEEIFMSYGEEYWKAYVGISGDK